MVIQSIHAQESQLANTIAYRYEESQPYQSLTDFDIPYPIDVTQESYCFGTQGSISSLPIELDQNLENHLGFCQVIHFLKLNLKKNVNLSLDLAISSPILESTSTHVYLN